MKNNYSKDGSQLSKHYSTSSKLNYYTLWLKFKRKIKTLALNKIQNTPFRNIFYLSYWHYKFSEDSLSSIQIKQTQYMCLQPNYGAGIGHQLANWNAGLYFAGYYNLKFANSPFSSSEWDSFLGFGEGEAQVDDLKKKKYKIVKLPRFDSENNNEISLIGKIINSYKAENILFSLESDQGYMRQFETAKILQNKFFSAKARDDDKLIYSATDFNIAIHIRRGDIVGVKDDGSSLWETRWLDNQYYVNILKQVLTTIKSGKRKVEVYLFSQGKQSDFKEFEQFDNVNYCFDFNAINTFLHMCFADLLISSKSSFSYKPALISKGIKISPGVFWHGYPKTNDYILADNQGNFNVEQLLTFFGEETL
jgi:hypothetical protein